MKNGWNRGPLIQTYGHFRLYEGLLFRDGNVVYTPNQRSIIYVDPLYSHEEQLPVGYIAPQQDALPSMADAVVTWLAIRMKNIRQTKQWICETQNIEQKKTYEKILANWEPAFYLVESCLREIESQFQLIRRSWQFEGWAAPVNQLSTVFKHLGTTILTVSSEQNLQSTLPPPYYDVFVQAKAEQFISIGFLSAQALLEHQIEPFLQAWLDSQNASLLIGQHMLNEGSSRDLRPLLQEIVTLINERLITVQKSAIHSEKQGEDDDEKRVEAD